MSELAAIEEHLDFIGNLADEETRYDNYDRIADACLEILHAVIGSTQGQDPLCRLPPLRHVLDLREVVLPRPLHLSVRVLPPGFLQVLVSRRDEQGEVEAVIGRMVVVCTLVMRVLLRAE